MAEPSTVLTGQQTSIIQGYINSGKYDSRYMDNYLIEYSSIINERNAEINQHLLNLEANQKKLKETENLDNQIRIVAVRELENERKKIQLQQQLLEYQIAFKAAAAAAMARIKQKQENDESADEMDDELLKSIQERYDNLSEKSRHYYETLSDYDPEDEFPEDLQNEIDQLNNEYDDLHYESTLSELEKRGFEVERDADGVEGRTRITDRDEEGNVRTQMTHDRNSHEYVMERLSGHEESMHHAADNIINLESSRNSGPEHNLECTLKFTPDAQQHFSTFIQTFEQRLNHFENTMPDRAPIYSRLREAINQAKHNYDKVDQQKFEKGMEKVLSGLDEVESSLGLETETEPTSDVTTSKSKLNSSQDMDKKQEPTVVDTPDLDQTDTLRPEPPKPGKNQQKRSANSSSWPPSLFSDPDSVTPPDKRQRIEQSAQM
ncbi:hypothetical protein L3V82_04555 [Thiotrichales bacterium 19S3-7]|nr:hypothetical protein [Thiotrichales bacterium 19S3-7]MCF6801367.1 hypothetical protein [Thiotrichales bacterium 19S3-11]